MNDDIIKLFGQNISNTRFTYEKYCGNFDVAIFDIMDEDVINSKYKSIGWCKSNNLQFRSKDNGIAVLFINMNDEEIWCHFDDYYLKTIFDIKYFKQSQF